MRLSKDVQGWRIMTVKYVPVLLGGDENAYSNSREYHEYTGENAIVFTGHNLRAVDYTKIIDLHVVPNFDHDDKIFLETLIAFGKQTPVGTRYILVGLADSYPVMITRYRSELEPYYELPYIDYDLLMSLGRKNKFISVAAENGLATPKTLAIDPDNFAHGVTSQIVNYPVIMKPADSPAWLLVDFPGRKKVYEIADKKSLDLAISDAFAAGYQGKLVVQEMIAGDITTERSVTAYVGRDHQVKVVSVGQPLLEDPTPWGGGNHVAIMPVYNDEINHMIKTFFENIRYTGFANVDIKYDERSKSYKAFDLNFRPGRSNYWATLNGVNWIEWLLRDYNGELANVETTYANQDSDKYQLWLQMPPRIFKKYADQSNSAVQAGMRLIKQGRYGFSYKYSKDWNFMRWAIYVRSGQYYSKNFKRYSN